MKDTDAVSGRLPAASGVGERPGFDGGGGVLETCSSLTGTFKDGEIVFNW